ncbi:SufE family protein [Pelagibacterium nitratireducens]|jgi:cysteine desulfuration protein SufE|uniref:SufE family protein n=1 Tax=Pelagibacterium nitratireducens TaxID=1046114 RepID=A0ABZ2I172_9HYPH|nr:cysteine desulfuration protein SufE [Pelagibacterium sp.]|tara:strand:+ start:262 stop:693 length:432 start_codon:yes stop_codon:yes gene_type:complete
MNTTAAFDEIADNLSFLDDWEDRYRYIIELGQGLAPLTDDERTATNKVHGCASQVWLVTGSEAGEKGTVLTFRGDSDAMIVRGLVAIVLALYSGRPAADIATTDALPILDSIGLREHLSTQRSNGLAAMVTRLRADAQAAVQV